MKKKIAKATAGILATAGLLAITATSERMDAQLITFIAGLVMLLSANFIFNAAEE